MYCKLKYHTFSFLHKGVEHNCPVCHIFIQHETCMIFTLVNLKQMTENKHLKKATQLVFIRL